MKKTTIVSIIILTPVMLFANMKDAKFKVNSNGTVTDTVNKLMWVQKPKAFLRNWELTKGYCINLKFAGYSDWRLPTRDEMVSLQRAGWRDGFALWLNKNGFKNLIRSYYWTSTIIDNKPMLVSLKDYSVIGYTKDFLALVIPVRSIK